MAKETSQKWYDVYVFHRFHHMVVFYAQIAPPRPTTLPERILRQNGLGGVEPHGALPVHRRPQVFRGAEASEDSGTNLN